MFHEKKIVNLEDFENEAIRRFGKDKTKWKYKCPVCGTIQCVEDFIKAGVPKEEIDGTIGFSCIGRFTKEMGCDWTLCDWKLGGLLQLHELEIATEDGRLHKHFVLAEAEK